MSLGLTIARSYMLERVLVCALPFRRKSSVDICYLGLGKNNMRGWRDWDAEYERRLVTRWGLSGVRSSTLVVLQQVGFLFGAPSSPAAGCNAILVSA